MIPQADITAWRQIAPWGDDGMVEQDLVLSRALIELFADPMLAEALALRGGTALHRLILAFTLEELLGTKLRALYQRRHGRDLFDLWETMTRLTVDPHRIVAAFREYVAAQGLQISRAEFERNLAAKAADIAFLDEVRPMLRPGTHYEPTAALDLIRRELVARLPGAPWQGR